MKPALKPALEKLDKALGRLETAIDKRFVLQKTEPQLDLNSRSEREVNKKVAVRLDQTISRLETLLSKE